MKRVKFTYHKSNISSCINWTIARMWTLPRHFEIKRTCTWMVYFSYEIFTFFEKIIEHTTHFLTVEKYDSLVANIRQLEILLFLLLQWLTVNWFFAIFCFESCSRYVCMMYVELYIVYAYCIRDMHYKKNILTSLIGL